MKVKGRHEIGPRMPLLAARVESIASRVRQGTYLWPTSQQIADRILDDALLTAKLQAMLKA